MNSIKLSGNIQWVLYSNALKFYQNLIRNGGVMTEVSRLLGHSKYECGEDLTCGGNDRKDDNKVMHRGWKTPNSND